MAGRVPKEGKGNIPFDLIVISKDVAMGLRRNHFVHRPLEDVPILSAWCGHLFRDVTSNC